MENIEPIVLGRECNPFRVTTHKHVEAEFPNLDYNGGMLTTQLSLIARLKDPGDDEAWRRFVCLYQPAIVRSLQMKGLQHADAEDTAQQVLISVAKSLAKRPHEPDRARFRTWLEKVIRNAALNAMQRASKDVGAGGSGAVAVLDSIAADESDSRMLAIEFQRQLFHVAAKSIEVEFEPTTWQAFWRTSVLNEPIESVAVDLGMQRGSVYAARSRVMRRFRTEVDQLREKYSSK